jgi:hypothetical protein
MLAWLHKYSLFVPVDNAEPTGPSRIPIHHERAQRFRDPFRVTCLHMTGNLLECGEHVAPLTSFGF